jgi:molecular chaperone HtpG
MTTPTPDVPGTPESTPFKAEIQQVLDILIHSLYSEREIFLRELLSNASDALHRFKLESLTQKQLVSPAAELAIWLEPDAEAGTLTVRDSGLGMTDTEMVENLGTIAHSGARRFLEAMKELNQGKSGSGSEVIGRFGVGFYSAFMVADEVTVTSRSFRVDEDPARWHSDGQGGYTVGPGEREERGTAIVLTFKDDAREYLEPGRLRQIVREHSNYLAFPVYLQEATGEGDEASTGWVQINDRTAPWRERPGTLEQEQLDAFYQQLTYDTAAPLRTIHVQADAPIQFHALLFIPSKRDHRLFQSQEAWGVRLYARKVLIQEQSKTLLPPYLRFLEGVVDSEDLPLNVSREMVQDTPLLTRIRTTLLSRVTRELSEMADEGGETFDTFYREYGVFLKEAIASDPSQRERFVDLLRFPSTRDEGVSLAATRERMAEGQDAIYYALGDDLEVLKRSAHLEPFAARDLEVLLLTDPVDSFLVMGLPDYQGTPLKNVDDPDLSLPEVGAVQGEGASAEGDSEDADSAADTPSDETFAALLARAKALLGERVDDVRESKLLVERPARLVSAGGMPSSFERAQRLMGQGFEPSKRVLELNPNSELIRGLSTRLETDGDDPLVGLLLEQLLETEMLVEGLLPDPAAMAERIRQLMEASLKGES